MSSKNVELADAIVELLNRSQAAEEEPYEFSFSAVRKAMPLTESELENLQTVEVMVFTGSVKAERRVQRGPAAFKRTYKPIVVIQRRLAEGTEEANLAIADKLIKLSDQVSARLLGRELKDLHFIGFDDAQDRQEYNVEMMRDYGVFSVVRTFEYSD